MKIASGTRRSVVARMSPAPAQPPPAGAREHVGAVHLPRVGHAGEIEPGLAKGAARIVVEGRGRLRGRGHAREVPRGGDVGQAERGEAAEGEPARRLSMRDEPRGRANAHTLDLIRDRPWDEPGRRGGDAPVVPLVGLATEEGGHVVGPPRPWVVGLGPDVRRAAGATPLHRAGRCRAGGPGQIDDLGGRRSCLRSVKPVAMTVMRTSSRSARVDDRAEDDVGLLVRGLLDDAGAPPPPRGWTGRSRR